MDRNKNESTPPSTNSSNDTPAKKPYTAPALLEWGTLRDLTQSVGATGGADGAKKGANRRTR